MATNDASDHDFTESHQFTSEAGDMNNATGKSMQFNNSTFNGDMQFFMLKDFLENTTAVDMFDGGGYFGRNNKESKAEILQKLRGWLIGNRIEKQYNASIGIRRQSTCDWILQNEEFKTWRLPSAPPKLFWIHGPPGFGKTILCARIIEHITTQQEIVAHYFFSSDLDSHQDPILAMQSWLYHIGKKNKSVANLVNKTRGNEPASRVVIINLFRQAISMVSNCTLVIDGLDECATDHSCLSVAEFIREINDAVRNTRTRILVISRPEPDIRQILKEANSVGFSEYGVRETDVHSDIEALSRDIVAKKLRDQDEAIQDAMTKKMTDQCQGQFLWLRLLQDSLSEGLSREQLQKAIKDMPTNLTELYSRSWKTIMKGNDRVRAISLLRLAVFSIRLLTVREISEAVLVSDDLPSQWDKEYLKEKILGPCCSFLKVQRPNPESPVEEWTIHTVHSTVKEFYLRVILQQNSVLSQSDSLRVAAEHSFLAELCIKYMNDSHTRENSTDDAAPSNSFTNYAVQFWNHHAQAGMAQQKNVLIEKMFDENSLSWTMWRKWFDSTTSGWVKASSDSAPAIPLCYAMELGYVDLAMTIIKKGEERVNNSSSSRTALGVACSKGYEDLVRDLLANGAKIGIRDAHGRTAIHYAAEHGHSELVKFLIDNGATINVQDYNGVSPFLAASSNGHLSIMRRLIQQGANIHQLDKDGNDALFKASSNGHLNAARVLIEKGVHRQLSSHFKTSTIPPIFVALRSDSFLLARLLIDEEENLNATSGVKRPTILHVAVYEGRTDIVNLLISHRDVNLTLQDVDGQTPFFLSCLHGHTKIVGLLIDRVDLTLQDADGQTPLFVACWHGYTEIVRLLINRGVDLTRRNAKGQTPFFVACLYGHIGIVKLFIENGVDVMTPDMEGKIPLYAACANHHLEIAELLINHVNDTKGSGKTENSSLSGTAVGESSETVQPLIKEDVDVSDTIRNRAILAASQGGNVDILKLLIKWIGDDIKNLNYEWTTGSISVACNIRDAALLLASRNGHADVVTLLLDKGANINVIDPHRHTALYAACCNVRVKVAKLLIMGGADINAIEEEGGTPLMAACANGCLDLVELLLEKKAQINAVNSDKISAAYMAAQHGHLEVLRLLLSQDAHILRKNKEGNLPIHIASQNGHSEIVDLLIQNGSDVTVVNEDGKTPFWLARLHHEIDVVDVLLKHGVDIDAKDPAEQTPLLKASSEKDVKMVKLLIKHCADVSIKDSMGQTPLSCASAEGHREIVKLLLHNGAKMTPNKKGQTPAYVASSKGHIQILRLLIESGADVSERDNQGCTLLHASCSSGHIKTTTLLLEMGADINSCNNDGFRPLYFASQNGHVTIVEYLILKGADSFKESNNGLSLITAASSMGHTKTVQFLIEKRQVETEKPDANGKTPLIAACEAGHVHIVSYLVEKGVKVNRIADDTTALRVACSNGHIKVVKLLLKHGADTSIKSQDGMTSIKAADQNGHTEICELLHTHYMQVSDKGILQDTSEDILEAIPKAIPKHIPNHVSEDYFKKQAQEKISGNILIVVIYFTRGYFYFLLFTFELIVKLFVFLLDLLSKASKTEAAARF